MVEFHKVCKIPGTDIPLPKSPTYSVLLRLLPTLARSIFNIRFKGLHRIPRKGPAIIAANHTSHIDPIAVICGSRRRLHYLAKDSHFNHFHTAIVMRTTGQIKTHRESGAADALSRASDILGDGRAMGIFPEGTRSRRKSAPYLQTGKTGVARLSASHPDVPVYPCVLNGAREVMAPGDKVLRPWKRVNVSYGEGITWNEWLIHPNGGNQSEESIQEILNLEGDEQRNALGALYRHFTNQLIGSLAALGAP
ncbi:MAG: lysophospholipid acyltransferase family protein [Candidatus Thermoplasmatota archaeon]|nr:lysophospholipid acyltransferase family protein [Candidatus Thermoplasmatota archaeon]